MAGNGCISAVLLTIPVVVQGNNAVPATGVLAGDLRIPFSFTILNWSIMADQAGSIELDIWAKKWAAGSPPTVADTICGGNYPALVASESDQGTLPLTGWTRAIPADYWIRWNLRSIATITFFTLSLQVRRQIAA
jgi:hypothetical protein